MNAPSKELASLLDTRRFLFFTGDSSSAQRLAAVLRHDGVVVQEDVVPDRLSARLAELGPQMVLLDFGADDHEPGKLLHASDLAKTLARVAPALPVVAVGSMTRPQGPWPPCGPACVISSIRRTKTRCGMSSGACCSPMRQAVCRGAARWWCCWVCGRGWVRPRWPRT